MATQFDHKVGELSEQLKNDLGEIELSTMQFTLADAIREGAGVTEKATGWGNGDTACALSGAFISAKARGYVRD